MAVALQQQAVTLDVGALIGDGAALRQQGAGRVVDEVFRGIAAHRQQPIQRVVVVAFAAFARVVDAGQVARGIVAVVALQQALLILAQAMGEQASRRIVSVVWYSILKT